MLDQTIKVKPMSFDLSWFFSGTKGRYDFKTNAVLCPRTAEGFLLGNVVGLHLYAGHLGFTVPGRKSREYRIILNFDRDAEIYWKVPYRVCSYEGRYASLLNALFPWHSADILKCTEEMLNCTVPLADLVSLKMPDCKDANPAVTASVPVDEVTVKLTARDPGYGPDKLAAYLETTVKYGEGVLFSRNDMIAMAHVRERDSHGVFPAGWEQGYRDPCSIDVWSNAYPGISGHVPMEKKDATPWAMLARILDVRERLHKFPFSLPIPETRLYEAFDGELGLSWTLKGE